MQNHLPAIVIFSIILGIAIQRVENKEPLLSMLDTFRKASVTIWGWIVLLAPVGVFALFADTIGTLAPGALLKLSLYLLAVISGTVILAFWALPSTIAALCPKTTREIIRDLQGALVTAIVTSLSVAALPYVQKATEKMASQMGVKDEDRADIIQTTLAVSYPLGQLGNFFILLFILFAAFYYGVPIALADQLLLPFIVLLSGIGSPSSSIDAVSFLAGWLNLPSGSTNLYVEMMTVTRYGQVLASVMGFTFICILATLNYYGKLRLQVGRLLRSVLVTCVVLVSVNAAGWIVQNHLPDGPTNPYMAFQLPPEITRGVDVSPGPGENSHKSPERPAATSLLDWIQARGEIRVGFNANTIPFSYHNGRGDLVGFDIAYAYSLARDLGVRLRLVPFEWQHLADDLANHRFDMAASGIYVTDRRIRQFDFSQPYYKSPLALIVHSGKAKHFLSRDSIEAQTDLKVAVFDDPVLLPIAKDMFRAGELEIVENYAGLNMREDIDAALWTLQQAKAWEATHSAYTAVVPKGMGGELLIAYLLPKGAPELRQYLNYWLRLQQVNGFHQRMVDLWLDGKPEVQRTPRWSILGHLIGWERK